MASADRKPTTEARTNHGVGRLPLMERQKQTPRAASAKRTNEEKVTTHGGAGSRNPEWPM